MLHCDALVSTFFYVQSAAMKLLHCFRLVTGCCKVVNIINNVTEHSV
jgi:hypothetical protein